MDARPDIAPHTAADALRTDRFLGFRVTPITRRRIDNFKRNRRGLWSFWIFLVLFLVSMFAELVANDKPLLVVYDGGSVTTRSTTTCRCRRRRRPAPTTGSAPTIRAATWWRG
jgi:hypothetical protein